MAFDVVLLVFLGLILVAFSTGVLSNILLAVNIDTAYEGGWVDYVAICLHSTIITTIQWTINGVPLTELQGINYDPIILNSRVVSLTIRNVSADLNDHTVGCFAVLNTGLNDTCSPQQTIQVQGILGPALNLTSQYYIMDNTVNISWIAPSAIIVPPAIKPEIFYCVQISNNSSTESIGCNKTVDMNEYATILLINVVCGINYNITVTPFNRLGEGVSLKKAFPDVPVISDCNTAPQLNGNSFTYIYKVSGLVCTCIALIQDVSVEGNLQCNLDTPGLITITTENIIQNKKISVLIFANNTRRFRAKDELISTFDTDLSISSVSSNVEYSLTFVNGSIARGVFIALLFMDGQFLDFNRSLYYIQERSTAQMTNQIVGLSSGRYEVLAYDIECSGEITSENAADQLSITVISSTASTAPLQMLSGIICDYTVEKISVNVMCEYNTTLYRGFRVYIQDTINVMLRFAESTVSGKIVSINGSLHGGKHLMMVYPLWDSDMPRGRLAPALKDIFKLDALTTIHSSTPNHSSSRPSIDPAISYSPPVVAPTDPVQNLATIIAVIIIIIAAAMLIVVTAIIIVRRNMMRKKHDSPIHTSKNTSYEVTTASLKRAGEPEYEEIFPQDQLMNLSDNKCYGVLSQLTPATQIVPASAPTSTTPEDIEGHQSHRPWSYMEDSANQTP